MPKKNKGGKKKQVKKEDDDWDVLLEAEAEANKSEKVEESKKVEEKETKDADKEVKVDAAAAFLASQGIGLEKEGVEGEKKKGKKKKKKKSGTEKEKEVSARGALIAEKLRKQREEEERLACIEAEEAARLVEIERKEEEENRCKEEEKERRKKKQHEKIERQKREGTYLTKKQKEKARLAEMRLESMRAAGMLPLVESNKKPVYGKKKKNQKQKQSMTVEEKTEEKMEEKDEEKEKKVEIEEKEGDWECQSSSDEWDADSVDDDKFADLEKKLAKVENKSLEENEDLIAKEKAVEKERLRQLGIVRSKREKEEAEKLALFKAQQEETSHQALVLDQKREEGRKRRIRIEKENLAARSRDDLRCPIVVIMGHVDTGKTSLLDKIRKTNVQEGEAGGITQQIGATYFEKKTLVTQTARLNEIEKFELTIPGMLVIDTPGHESFTNLRSRGSNLCDVAVLVVDLMHGLEPQTIESLNMLKSRETPFIVALNKVDRCYAWKTCNDLPIREALKEQSIDTVQEFRTRATQAKVELQEQSINSNIYWEMGEENWETSDFVPLVPTSAITGEGIQDILLLLCQMAQRRLWKQLMWCANLQCTVLELKTIEGLGMTIDVLLVNGFLREGDKAVFCTLDGPILTEIRGLLTPPPSREMRIKCEYIHHKVVKGALGVKIIGNNLEKVMAGTPVLICNEDDEEEDIKSEVMSDLTTLQSKLSTDKKGVMVHASTLGALEALLQFLREETKPPIPVSAIGIGAVHKKDITKISIMNEKKCPEYATVLAFDVLIEREAREYANEMKVRIFTADIIYHLFDQFTRFMDDFIEQKRQDSASVAVFPCILKILPQHIFNQKDPIILGVEIFDGILKVGTPLCAPSIGGLHIGKVQSIESNGKQHETIRKGGSVAIKIVNESNPNLTYGRQFDSTHSLYSTLTRASIDALKENFKDKLENEDWKLVVKLKKVFNII